VNHYYNVGEVASACRSLAATFRGTAKAFALAEASHQGTTPVGLRLGDAAAQAARPVFMIVGGLHGDEWGSCEIILNLASDLLHGQAAGLDYGNGVQYSAAQVLSVLSGLDLVLVPLVNPDGRAFSQTQGQYWRKNRRPAVSRGGDAGVDLNRNFDFDFALADNPGGVVAVSGSGSASDPFYRGPHPFSEPETRNVKALVEQTEPHWFADLHSGARCILHPRSVATPLAPQDAQAHAALAARYAQAVGGVSGDTPSVEPGFDIVAASGTSHDWVQARARPPGAAPTLAFSIEWSVEHIPLPHELEPIAREVSAGLIAMFLEVV
jgi:murein tripeptide amidase MpaA